jgi:nitrogen fixation/metabolism regulation signal transduction histidine kinase
MKLSHFKVQISLRMAALFLGLLLLAFGIAYDIRLSLIVVLIVFITLQASSLVRYINYTNKELESFLAGLKFGDFQQTYTISHLGPSFRRLEKTLQFTVEKFKSLRTQKEQQAIYFQSLVQHIPIPFFVVHGDQRVEILNNATRRTFNVADITNTGELANFGAAFQRDVLQIQPGETVLSTIELAGAQEYFIMTATQLTTGGRIHKLVSLQNVQGEIDATELATWQNLLRVTSHEILNSLAPVSSCAQTAKTLVDDALDREVADEQLQEDLQDIGESLGTVLRRSEGLTRFIQSYRQLSRLPPPNRKSIRLDAYFKRLESLVRGEPARKKIELSFQHDPPSLAVVADEDMLDQALINLIRNAANALEDTQDAHITVNAYTDSKQRTVLEVQDNGPGVPEDLAENIFIPFFTTRTQGSGVGLALVRYIMLSHGGKAIYYRNELGGASFRLIFS